MSLEEKVSLTISIAKSYRDRLRTIAAKRNLHDLDQLTSASTIAREIICDQIDELERVEADFQATDTESSNERVSGQIEESVIEQ
ncbi:hypothetical protein [uncultured Desulfosarcina sp.]|uniref:hypothetical protein n=1 Tax=uncultured Desulfosarcina sp. TaxID=218289 RepID=UPI0029C93266|nr:hypothetical protein [uncultured Desulfosarcina sp.]